MSFLKTLSYLLPLSHVRSHIVFSWERCLMYPLTQDYVAPLEQLLADGAVVTQMELGFSDALDKAQAHVQGADGGLNEFADKVSRTVLTLTHDDRSHTLYTLFFADKQLSSFKRPILGSQLYLMRKWGPSLEGSEHPALTALAPELPGLIAVADAAVAARAVAEQKKKEFREIGLRRKYIDKVNADRRSLWAELSKLPHKHVELSSRFADQFFRRDVPAGDEMAEPTVETVQDEIDGLAEQIEAKQSLLATLKQRADLDAAAEQALQAKEAKLAAMQKEIAARLLEQEALRAEIQASR